MDKKKALELHLFEHGSLGEWQIFSSLIGALRNTRHETGRNNDGDKIPNADHGSWLGAIGYMTILDQIGTCFKPSSKKKVNGNSINKALKYFSNLNVDEVEALYALRCAFAHDFSLYNKNSNQKRQHRFTVLQGPHSLVQLPKRPWGGNFMNNDIDMNTIVNLEVFGDLVESIYRKLIELFNKDELEIVLDGGPKELIQRYQIWTKHKK